MTPSIPSTLGSTHLARFRDVGRLVLRYAAAPGVRSAGLGPQVDPDSVPDDETPAELARDLEAMGPTFVKLGQLLSTRPDLLPQPYLDALGRLQDEVSPVPSDEARSVLEEELGVRASRAFRDFVDHPLAAASLGQVHRATLRDGRRVAVKIQRPGVHEVVQADLAVMRDLAALADEYTEAGRRYAFGALLEEFERSLLAEMDYRREAENLDAMADAMADFERIVVPRPVHDFTTARVLTMELVDGRSLRDVSPMARLETDGSDLLDDLFRAYLHQALVRGVVHADPHPGNLLLTPDGKLALLDMGMVLHIPETMRRDLLRFLIAMGDGDEEEVARRAESMGQARAGYDRDGFRRGVGALVTRATEVGSRRGAQMGRLVMGIARLGGEHGLRPPPELSLVGKTLLNLDGIAHLLDEAFDPTDAVRRHAMELTRHRVMEMVTPGQAAGALLETKEFVEELPGRVNRALDAVGNNDLEVRVRVIDEARLLTGLQQMANRITSGLVLAALIVGAAWLMDVETSLTLLGYPVLAIVLFVAAAIGGIGLLYRIWRSDRETRRDLRER